MLTASLPPPIPSALKKTTTTNFIMENSIYKSKEDDRMNTTYPSPNPSNDQVMTHLVSAVPPPPLFHLSHFKVNFRYHIFLSMTISVGICKR